MLNHRDTVMNLMKQGRFAEALPMLLRLTESDPSDWYLFYAIGQCYRSTYNYPEAVQSLKKASKLNPDESEIFLALGIAYQLTEEYSSAVATLKQSISLDPQQISAYNSIGLTYRKSGDFEKALEWYSQAEELYVGEVAKKVEQKRDKCYRDEIVEGKKSRVVLPYFFEKTHEMLRSEPIYAFIKNNIGVCLVQLGDIGLAQEAFKESIEFIPDGFNYPDPFKNLESISTNK